MKVTLAASTGAWIEVWKERDLLCARRVGEAGEPQTCLAVDLFEVIAELAQLELEDARQAEEAIRLAKEAQRRLGVA